MTVLRGRKSGCDLGQFGTGMRRRQEKLGSISYGESGKVLLRNQGTNAPGMWFLLNSLSILNPLGASKQHWFESWSGSVLLKQKMLLLCQICHQRGVRS